MTAPVDTTHPAPLSPRVEAEIEHRLNAGGRDGWLAWERHTATAGGCSQPVRLRGRAMTVHAGTGEVIDTYKSHAAPDGIVYKACGTRRASICPSCAHTYQHDAYHLLRAGLAGSRSAGVPETVALHPLIFLTLTAPSFGLVHGRRVSAGREYPCRGRRDKTLCPHGRPTWCSRKHRPSDPAIGKPLCGDCYDYTAHVAWNHHASELWRRTSIGFRRALDRLGKQHGIKLRASFGKVAEYQARGVVHFHALIRLDQIDPLDPAELLPPPACIDAARVAELVAEAARVTRFWTAPHPDSPDGAGWAIGWGRQIDTRVVRDAETVGTLTDGTDVNDLDVASYLAKYATKSTEAVGQLARRLTPATAEKYADPATHAGRLIAAAWRLGRPSALQPPDEDGRAPFDRLRAWAHMLGFGGHFLTKSRAYSTTFAERRGKRATWRRRHHLQRLRDDRPDLADVLGDLADHDAEETTLVIGQWTYDGSGWLSDGDHLLALASAARAREYRDVVRDELRSSQ